MTDPFTPFGPDYITERQYDALLRVLNPARVAQRKQGGASLSYLEQADVRAHLTRIFGFLNWDSRVLTSGIVFVDDAEIGKEKKPGFQVTCTSTVQLVIRSLSGRVIFDSTEAAAASNAQPDKAAAYETALKSATSDALKRCAINLGDQFGLGLYRKKNQETAYIKQSLVEPEYFGRREARLELKKVDLQPGVEHTEAPAPAVVEDDSPAVVEGDARAVAESDPYAAVADDDPYAAADAAMPEGAGIPLARDDDPEIARLQAAVADAEKEAVRMEPSYYATEEGPLAELAQDQLEQARLDLAVAQNKKRFPGPDATPVEF